MMKNMMNKEITIVNFMALISSNVVGLVLAIVWHGLLESCLAAGYLYPCAEWEDIIIRDGARTFISISDR